MSVQSIAQVLTLSRSEGSARLVLIAIANHDGDGGSWPSVPTIAAEANVSERTVQRALADLEDLGEIVIHLNDGGDRRTRPDRRPNRYEITLDNDLGGTETGPVDDPDDPENIPPEPVDNPPERGDKCVTPSRSRGDTQGMNGVTLVSPEPSFNQIHPPTPTGKPAGEIPIRGCPAHPGGRLGCRACGLSARQQASAAAEAAKAARQRRDRALQQAAIVEARGRRAAADAAYDPAKVDAHLAQLRRAADTAGRRTG